MEFYIYIYIYTIFLAYIEREKHCSLLKRQRELGSRLLPLAGSLGKRKINRGKLGVEGDENSKGRPDQRTGWDR